METTPLDYGFIDIKIYFLSLDEVSDTMFLLFYDKSFEKLNLVMILRLINIHQRNLVFFSKNSPFCAVMMPGNWWAYPLINKQVLEQVIYAYTSLL